MKYRKKENLKFDTDEIDAYMGLPLNQQKNIATTEEKYTQADILQPEMSIKPSSKS